MAAKLKIKDLPIADIVVGKRFREGVGDISDLVTSIKEKGFFGSIVVDEKNNLAAGRRRLEAAKQAKMAKIPCTIIPDSEIDLREIELIENVARQDFTWSERAALEAEIMELKKKHDPNWTVRKQAEFLGQSSGASQRRLELAAIMDAVPELAEAKTEDEAWKRYKRLQEEVVLSSMRDETSKGDYDGAVKYAARHYKIGNALDGLKKVNPGTVDFCEVDPPYGVDLQKKKSRNVDMKKLDRYNEVPVDEYREFLGTVTKECFRILKQNTWCVWWYGPKWYTHVYIALREAGFQVNEVPAIWTKENFQGQTASPDTALGSSYEPFFYARKGNPSLSKPGRKNEFRFEPVAPQKKIHPTERPIGLMNEIMETFTYPNSVVCVPFLGSGVTLRAAYLAGHTGYGWDLDDMCKERFLNAVYRDEMENGKAKE